MTTHDTTPTTTTGRPAKRCCGTSVGVLITSPAGLVMVTRGWWPLGTAPVAGHVKDAHTGVADALVAEVKEEVGLTVVGAPRTLWRGHLPNLCASLPAVPVAGHAWEVAEVSAEGEITPAPGETRGARVYTWAEVAALAAVTLTHYRAGGTPDTQPHASLEAVWLRLLREAGYLPWLTQDDLALAETAYATPPGAYWLGGRP
ncbi:NUDIX domain-containing protein [Nocardiopsis flavescens]|uniref:NUDIX domain-containing protein n=1 Tax=Nocardiopsis flavescens TaxID=758803 RepID=A0A1M6WEU7_9ACTN|nr:NUDIX domain-containing protein [Nocardiopsis flavescens]SHK92208.1 NUDIX domain-containing protein [Nocardiopsis flavescens]